MNKENKQKSSKTTTFSVDDQFMQNLEALEEGEEKLLSELVRRRKRESRKSRS